MNKRALLLVMAAPLLAVLVACGGGKKNNSSSAAPTIAASSGSNAGSSSAPQASGSTGSKSSGSSANNGNGSSANTNDLVAAMTKFANTKTWSAKIEDTADPTNNGTFDYVAPDKYHINLGGQEIIAIGTDTYVKQNGTWIKLPGLGSSGPLFDANGFQDTIDAAKQANVTKGGTDTVNGTKCQIYSYTDTSINNKVDVCVADGLPVRVVQDDGESKSTITFDFKSNISIKPPI